MKESGVLEKTALVFGQMNEPPRCPYACSGDRDLPWRNISVMRSTRTCFCLLIISSVSPRPDLRYPLFWDVCLLPLVISLRWLQKWVSFRSVSLLQRMVPVTSVQAVYVPADDLTDPAPATTFAHLDATTVLSRKIVEQGILSGCRSAGIYITYPGGRCSWRRTL